MLFISAIYENWRLTPSLQAVPVYYASQLAAKALRVYQTFINMMNRHISSRADVSNPFNFQFVKNINQQDVDERGPCVVMASPGMLQSGLSRRLFERWCDHTQVARMPR